MGNRKARIGSRCVAAINRELRNLTTNERGMALILAVVTLVVLTVIGIAALSSTNTDLKVVQAEKAYNVSLYNADAGTTVAGEVLEEAIALRYGSSQNNSSYKTSGDLVHIMDGAFWDETMVYNQTAMSGAGLSGSRLLYVAWPYDYYNDQNNSLAYAQAAHNHDEDVDPGALNADKGYDLKVTMTLGGGAKVSASVDVDYLKMEQLAGGSNLMAMGYEGMGKGIAGGGAKRIYGFAIRGDGPSSLFGATSKVRVYVTYDHII
ncbi:MAG TPA: hypothetical protein VMU60_08955 [Syntrophobacteria bacterium]|nr:hypothetical protein [Syntrophobacteria bacterium]